jgi:DNA-binding transcriptional LysR family regulator
MPSPLDLDQLQTFVAISDTGSFTRAADEVFKTQSAVSMQMRRLEEKIGRPLFEKEGRMNRLTDDGERLLSYARRMIRLNGEAVAAFDDSKLTGHLRIGMPDDYADRFLPEIMARFVRSNPRVELSVICEPTVNLVEQVNRAAIDLALITHVPENGYSEIVRREPLLWVTSANHAVHEEPVLPLAFGRPTCIWRHKAIEALAQVKREYRVLFTSWSATVISASILSGLAVSVLAECSLRPGMRVLTDSEGFPKLPDVEIGLIRARGRQSPIVDAMAQHVIESLDNLGPTGFGNGLAEDQAAIRVRRTAGPIQPRW